MPSQNARISVEGTSLETFTDADGNYRLAQVPAGTARVSAFFTGLAPGTTEVRVGAGETVQHNITMAGFSRGAAGDDTVRLAEYVVGMSREMDAAAHRD